MSRSQESTNENTKHDDFDENFWGDWSFLAEAEELNFQIPKEWKEGWNNLKQRTKEIGSELQRWASQTQQTALSNVNKWITEAEGEKLSDPAAQLAIAPLKGLKWIMDPPPASSFARTKEKVQSINRKISEQSLQLHKKAIQVTESWMKDVDEQRLGTPESEQSLSIQLNTAAMVNQILDNPVSEWVAENPVKVVTAATLLGLGIKGFLKVKKQTRTVKDKRGNTREIVIGGRMPEKAVAVGLYKNSRKAHAGETLDIYVDGPALYFVEDPEFNPDGRFLYSGRYEISVSGEKVEDYHLFDSRFKGAQVSRTKKFGGITETYSEELEIISNVCGNHWGGPSEDHHIEFKNMNPPKLPPIIVARGTPRNYSEGEKRKEFNLEKIDAYYVVYKSETTPSGRANTGSKFVHGHWTHFSTDDPIEEELKRRAIHYLRKELNLHKAPPSLPTPKK